MNKKAEKIRRPPVIGVFGHIDHGKSTLLDYIRKTNVTEKEAGGITQHISAYEVEHKNKKGEKNKIVFLDTPGHAAFKNIRAHGAGAADIAVLIVSGEDGVKPQTLEALECIRKDKLPFVVAISKIDKPGADVEKTKQNLAENNVYLEGYGGNVPWTAISSKTGEGVEELLDLLILVSELEDFWGNSKKSAEGVIIESNVDAKKGITTTAIIKDGTMKKGQYAVSGKSISPIRIFEDFLGKPINSASFSSPVRIIGWDSLPIVGKKFVCVDSKKEAQNTVASSASSQTNIGEETKDSGPGNNESKVVIPIILKADTAGSLEAVIGEIKNMETETVRPKIILSGVGSITENDLRTAAAKNSIVLGFSVKIDSRAQSLIERLEIPTTTFDVIYKLTEHLAEIIKTRTPVVEVEKVSGSAKVLRTFSKTKDKQVIGGRVESGNLKSGGQVKIVRRDSEIGFGKIKEIQSQKIKIDSIDEGNEFGMMVESKTEIVPGDKIVSFRMVAQ
jgi:translation initiation factor IF-2